MIGLYYLIKIFVLHERFAIYNNDMVEIHRSVSTFWKGRVVDGDSQRHDDSVLWRASRLDDGSVCASDCVVDGREYQRKVECGGWISREEVAVGHSEGVFALDILSASWIRVCIEPC